MPIAWREYTCQVWRAFTLHLLPAHQTCSYSLALVIATACSAFVCGGDLDMPVVEPKSIDRS